MAKLEPGEYWVRCAYTNRYGELDVYLTTFLLTDGRNYLEVKREVLADIASASGTNPGEVTFRKVR